MCNQERFGQEENRKSIREKYESVCHNVHVDCKFIQVHIYSYTSPAIDTRVYPTYHPELKAEEGGRVDGIICTKRHIFTNDVLFIYFFVCLSIHTDKRFLLADLITLR